jgi:hypothetical protein
MRGTKPRFEGDLRIQHLLLLIKMKTARQYAGRK